MLGSSISRFAWSDLIARTRPNYTVDVAWLDRFRRNFDEDVRIQAELTKQNIGIVAIRMASTPQTTAPQPSSSAG